MAKKRILVIDDEPALCKVIQVCLETLGSWVVLTATSGKEGLYQAFEEQPDAILLDVMMPEVDGLTVLKKLRNNLTTQAIPVVLLTANISDSKSGEYSQLDIAGAISKPFEPVQLVEQLKKILE